MSTRLLSPLPQGVRQIIFPTAWMNQLPLLDTIQFQRAFSLGANVTLLAANIRNDGLIMTGSGIYTPHGATYHHALLGAEPQEGRLLVARVPVWDPQWVGVSSPSPPPTPTPPAAAAVPGFCHKEAPCSEAPNSVHSAPPTFVSSMMYDPFTFAALDGARGRLQVCHGAFCCRLQYRRLPADGATAELYALGAFAGTHTVNGRYAVQVRGGGSSWKEL